MPAEVLNCLFPGPAIVMDSRVHYQAHSAESLACQLPVPAIRVAVQTELRPQRFGIECPSFGERAVRVKLADVGKPGLALRERDLENMPRNCFVQHQRFL